MKKDKVVFFDIDYTLFDQKKFRKKIYQAISAILKLSKNEIVKVGEELVRTKVGVFDPEVFAKRLTKFFGREHYKKRITNLFYNDNLMQSCLYKESQKAVEDLQKKALIVIFSKGKDVFQRAKISAIKPLLEDKHIHITTNKYETLPKLIKRYKKKKLYLVDDALDVLHAAKRLNLEIFTIWVKRGEFAEKQKPITGFESDAVISNLKEALTLIRN